MSGTQRNQYQAQYNSLLANVKSFIQDAGYNGKTLIGNITGSSGTFARVATVRNEFGRLLRHRDIRRFGAVARSAINCTAVGRTAPQRWPRC